MQIDVHILQWFDDNVDGMQAEVYATEAERDERLRQLVIAGASEADLAKLVTITDAWAMLDAAEEMDHCRSFWANGWAQELTISMPVEVAA